MADNNNYYEWLELPIEKFESNPTELIKILDRKKTEWASHKSISVQNRANIHYEKIKAAINDSDEWKSIYNEYVENVTADIKERLVYFVNDLEISQSDLEDIAKSFKVSANYVKTICDQCGYKVSGEGTAKGESDVTFVIDDMKPKAVNKLDPVQKLIKELGEADLFSLLKNPDFKVEISLSTSSLDDKVREALDIMKERWAKVPMTGSQGTQKSHIDKVYAGFISFLKENPFSEYIQYLKYVKAKDILNGVKKTKVAELSEMAFNQVVRELSEFTEDRDKAKSALIAFCNEKKIGFPVERKKIAVCPFCSHSFVRKEPIDAVCPSCGKALTVICPVCKKQKHLLIDSSCDGINIGNYPNLQKRLDTAENFCLAMNFDSAIAEINALNSIWPDYPGAKELETKINGLKSKYSSDIENISLHCSRKEYISARTIIDKINGAFPGFKNNYPNVYKEIENAENQFRAALSEQNEDRRVSLLLSIYDYISDYSALNTELQKYPVMPVSDISAIIDPNNGVLTLHWKSDNKPNSVFYTVYKKQGGIITAAGEGEEIAKTQGFSCTDNNAAEGKAYYYAVFASRGPLSSLTAMNEPQIVLTVPEIIVTPKDSSLDLSWNSTVASIRVFYSEGNIEDYNDGTEVSGVSNTGVLIENLSNGTPYQISAYKYINYQNKEYRSKLALISKAVPIKPIEPPSVTKSLGKSAGVYILKINNVCDDKPIAFYYTENLVGIAANTSVSLFEIEKKAKKLVVNKVNDGMYSVDMAGIKQMYVYPGYNISGTLAIGDIISLTYIEPTKLSASMSGSSLCIVPDKWPENTNQVTVCYDFSSFPEDTKDCDRSNRTIVSKQEYDSKGYFEIMNVQQRTYYISVFARKNSDHIPIGMLEFDLSPGGTIKYEFRKSLLGGTVITIHNESKNRPTLIFATASGGIPLSKDSAEYTYIIEKNENAPQTETITLPKSVFRPGKNSYGRLFCENNNIKVLVTGSQKLT